MSKREALTKQYQKALATLEEVLTKQPDPGEEAIYRDSAIQRFGFCFDLSWKLMKELLNDQHGIQCASPKTCLQHAFQQHMITEESLWLTMLEMRNLSSHTYNEDIANDIYAKLPASLTELKKLGM